MTAFEIGRNIAMTPGKVVFRNETFELIQYSPTKAETHEYPLIIFPPWINKFYILDLNAKKSFVKWAVDQGLTVFIVSWVNANEAQARKSFSDYMREGFLTAIQAAQDATGAPKVNVIGYCIGGTLDRRLARLDGGAERPTESMPPPSSRRRSISRRPATSWSMSTRNR